MENSIKVKWKIWVLSAIVFLNGALDIVQIITTRFRVRSSVSNFLFPFEIRYLSRSFTFIFGFLLIYFSLNLLERKKIAWLVITIISFLSILTQIGKGHFFYTAAAPLLMFILLVIWRKSFIVRSEPIDARRNISLIFLIMFLVIIYGTFGFWLMDAKDFGISFSFGNSIIRSLEGFSLIGNGDLIPHTAHAIWFLDSFQWVGTVTILLVIYSLFQPVKYRFLTLPHERETVEDILKNHSFSTDDYFKISQEKSHFFSEDKKCFIAYKAASGVAVVLGDPNGPGEKIKETTKDFLKFWFENGWSVIFIYVLPNFIRMYKDLGMRVFKIGEDAVVNLEHFCSFTVGNRSFRKIRNRFERAGFRTVRYLPPNSEELIDELEEVSNEWLKLPNKKERSFVLGRFSRDYVRNMPLFALRDANNKVVAFLNQIPTYVKGASTIDMMRHRMEVPNSTMEYLFSEFFKVLKEEGYKRINLGMAPFVGLNLKSESDIEERALRMLSGFLSRFFSYKGLRMFKSKFEPDWEERYVAYRSDPLNLLRTIMAVSKVVGF